MTEQEEFEFRHRFESERAAPKSAPRIDPTEGMSDWQKAAAGAGASLMRLGRGAGQLVGLSSKADEDEARRLEGPLMSSGEKVSPPIQSGRMGIHPAERPNRVTPGPAGAGAIMGAAIPLAAISTLVPGANTVLGSAAVGGGTGAIQPVGTNQEESRLSNISLGALAGGGVAAGMKGAGYVASKMLAKSESGLAGEASRNSVRDATLKAAQEEGYVIPPSAAGGGSVSKGLESVGGKAATGQEASIRNQEVTNKIARREAGLAEDAPITEKALADAREKIAAPYREIASVSPKAATALEDLKATRTESKIQWQAYNRIGDPKFLKKAQAADAKAEGLEKTIEGEATKVAKKIGVDNPSEPAQDLVAALRESRKALAKNYDVERALNVGNGNVDAHVIGRMLDKRGEAAMSGGLATIGKFAESFGRFAREAGSVPAPGVSKLAPYGSIALGAIGGGASEYTTGTPYGAAAAALPLLSGPARSIALSRMMQPRPSYTPGMSLRLADVAANSPRLRAMLPAGGAGAVVNAEQQ